MNIKVIGVAHIQGTSKKSGKPFDNTVVYFNRRDPHVNGLVGDNVWLNPTDFPADSINVGGEYALDCDTRGYCIGFAPVK